MWPWNSKMTGLGITNDKWGVCGFTSTFYAMYQLNPASRPLVVNATAAYRVLAEIKTYLMLLKAEGSPLLDDIRDFTQSFGPPHDAFTVDDYIQRINDAAAGNRSEKDILGEERYGIALPPAAVADYISRVWGWRATVHAHPNCPGSGNGIIGVRVVGTGGSGEPYKGLIHYMYRGNGSIYSWGKKFGSVKAAAQGGGGGANWEVCYFISLSRK